MSVKEYIENYKAGKFVSVWQIITKNPNLGKDFTKEDFFELACAIENHTENQSRDQGFATKLSVVLPLFNKNSSDLVKLLKNLDDLYLLAKTSPWMNQQLVKYQAKKILSFFITFEDLLNYLNIDKKSTVSFFSYLTEIVNLINTPQQFLALYEVDSNISSKLLSEKNEKILALFNNKPEAHQLIKAYPHLAPQLICPTLSQDEELIPKEVEFHGEVNQSRSLKHSLKRIAQEKKLDISSTFLIKALGAFAIAGGVSLLVIGLLALEPITIVSGGALVLSGIMFFKSVNDEPLKSSSAELILN